MNLFLHKIKRRFQRIYIKIKKINNPSRNYKKTEAEIDSCAIFRKLVRDKDSELLISPLSEKYYVKRGDILVILESHQISIINHIYGYNIPINKKVSDLLIKFFFNEVELRRNNMEQDYRNNVIHSLKSLFESLSN